MTGNRLRLIVLLCTSSGQPCWDAFLPHNWAALVVVPRRKHLPRAVSRGEVMRGCSARSGARVSEQQISSSLKNTQCKRIRIAKKPAGKAHCLLYTKPWRKRIDSIFFWTSKLRILPTLIEMCRIFKLTIGLPSCLYFLPTTCNWFLVVIKAISLKAP